MRSCILSLLLCIFDWIFLPSCCKWWKQPSFLLLFFSKWMPLMFVWVVLVFYCSRGGFIKPTWLVLLVLILLIMCICILLLMFVSIHFFALFLVANDEANLTCRVFFFFLRNVSRHASRCQHTFRFPSICRCQNLFGKRYVWFDQTDNVDSGALAYLYKFLCTARSICCKYWAPSQVTTRPTPSCNS